MRKKIAIDAKELSKKNIGSLGQCLLGILVYFTDYDLILFSDKAIPENYIPENAETIIREIDYVGDADLFRYNYWIKKECEKRKIDWYYQINHFSLFKIRNAKQMVVIHDLFPIEKVSKKTIKIKILFWVSVALTLINADVIVTVSEFTKQRIKHFFWDSCKVSVNYSGIEKPDSIVQEKNTIDGKFIFNVGRVSYTKGTVELLNFYSKYFKDSKYKLVIAGQAENDHIKKTVMEIVNRAGNIIWLDYVDDETRDWLMANASLFLYPSRYDGFGKPPLEAAVLRTPILINDLPVMREVTKGAATYVDFYGDQDALYRKICDMLEHPNLVQIERLYNIAKEYTWESFAKRTIELMK